MPVVVAAHVRVADTTAAAIPGRAPIAARAAAATAAQAVRTIDPTKVRTAARPMPAARAARPTARTAPLPEAPVTCLPPARKAKPTTARRSGARRPVPMAPSPAAAAARAPRALTAKVTPVSAKARRQPARGGRHVSRHRGYSTAHAALPTDAGYGVSAARTGSAAYAGYHQTEAVSGSVYAARGAAVRSSYQRLRHVRRRTGMRPIPARGRRRAGGPVTHGRRPLGPRSARR